jgi:hypothetical protein
VVETISRMNCALFRTKAFEPKLWRWQIPAMSDGAHAYGDLSPWPTKERLAEILRDAGLKVYVGKYSVRVDQFSHFSFEHYGSDLGDPVLEADAESVSEILQNVNTISRALTAAGIVHRFEVYDESNAEIGYFHFGWPKNEFQDFTVVFAEVNTGIVVTPEGERCMDRTLPRMTFKTHSEAESFARVYVQKRPTIECSIRDSRGVHLKFIRAGESE